MSDWSLVDVNAWLGHWPFRQTPDTSGPAVVRKLTGLGVERAWVGHLAGLFDRDIEGGNRRLAAECRGEPAFFVPFGTVHPLLPDWSEDLRRCHEVHGCRGIRLAPGFHGYDIGAPEFAECLRQATSRGLVVQVVCGMEDERTQNPQFRVPFVDLKRLSEVLGPIANVRLVLLNAFRKLAPALAAELAGTGKVWFDLAMLEGVDRVGQLVQEVGPRPLLWGSHFPLFVPESAQLKLTESELPRPILETIARGNAEALLPAKAP